MPEAWPDDDCPKCGTSKPSPGDVFNRGAEEFSCYEYDPGEEEYTSASRPCSCIKMAEKFWGGYKKIIDPGCLVCSGSGVIPEKEYPAKPDRLIVTCPTCGYKAAELPMDKRPPEDE